ncbi:MAG: U32 family peptidase [Lachnospiraceae bacterium]|nr:U32 family peptidase [Lachnospiraceae bacterium]
MYNKTELLAPAGTYEGFLAALSAGADAVYAGGQHFSARAYAGNLSDDELLSAIDMVHILGKKLYLTLNTLCKEREFKEIYDYIAPLYIRGLDGVIVQDIGIVCYLKREFPDLPVHASTQMSISGIDGINCMRDMGVSRVVPARELTLEEIKNIRNETDMELECFIHGAMCYSYSGQCLFSSFLGGRSGNRGRCAQPCRLPYKSVDYSGYPLSMKDMCTLDILPELMAAGISSFKIEGRMKKPEYTYTVTGMYRKYMDLVYSGNYSRDAAEFKKDFSYLMRQYVRGEAGTGYYYKRNGRDLISLTSSSYNADSEISNVIKEEFKISPATVSVDMKACLVVGREAELTISCGDTLISVTGGMCQAALKAPLDEERIKKQLTKTGGTLFSVRDIDVKLQGDIFISMGELNDLRRKAFNALYDAMAQPFFRTPPQKEEPRNFEDKEKPVQNNERSSSKNENPVGKKRSYTLCFEDKSQLLAVMDKGYISRFERIYVEAHLLNETRDILFSDSVTQDIYGALPYIIRDSYRDDITDLLNRIGEDERIKGVLVRNYEGLKLCLDNLDKEKRIVADAGLYTFNREACSALLDMGVSELTLPLEINIHEMRERGYLPCSELLYYGRVNMMLCANCVDKTVRGCHRDKGGALSYIKDRYQNEIPVLSNCSYCYNRILNPKPLCLFSEAEAVNRMGTGALRIHLTVEDEEETGRVLDAAFGSSESIIKDHTKGHFRKSVE